LQSSSATTVNINFSDKTILTWGTTAGTVAAPNRTATDGTTITNFVVDAGDTWNFASTGSILNKVVAGNNTTNGSLGGAAAAAVINGTILGSNAKVYVLANGGIIVGNGAQLNTQNLVLSTLGGENDGTFITLGDLMYTGSSTGSISLGTISAGGNVTAHAGAITTAGTTVGSSIAGDLVLRQVTAGTGLNLSAGGATVVGGNLTVTTNNGTITQTNGVTVGAGTTTVQTATLNSGTAAITVNNIANDFETVAFNTSGTGGIVTLRDANIVTLGASNIGGDLDVKVGGRTSTTGIATSGTVAVGGNAWLDSTSSANSGITVANSSTIAGYVTAQSAGGAISITTAGNLTVGNITSNATATTFVQATNTNGAGYTAMAAPTATTAGGAVTAITLPAGWLASPAPIYTGNLTLTIAAPTAAATAPAPVAGGFAAAAATVTNAGSGYGAAPTVTVVGGGGTGATATVVMAGDAIASISINGGTGYTTVPTIVITDPVAGAVAAQATAVRDATTGLITSVTITNAGVGYGATAPTVGTLAVNTANNYASGGVTANTTGTLTTAASGFTVNAASGVKTSQGVTLRGSSVTTGAAVAAGTNGTVTLQSNAGNVTIGGATVTANRVTVNATGDVLVAAGGNISTSGATNNATTANNFTATGNISLDNIAGAALALGLNGGQQINVTAPNASIRSANNITLGTANVTGNLSLRAGGTAGGGSNRSIALGRGTGSDATTARVGGTLTVITDGTSGITQNADSLFEVFGGVNARTGFNNQDSAAVPAYLAGGAITLDAAAVPGALTPSVRFGIVNAHTGLAGGAVTLAESTTLNIGNITASGLVATSTAGSIIDSGAIALAAGGTANFTVSGNNNVVIDTATNVIPVINVTGGVDNSFTALNAATRLESTTGSTGTTTVGTNTNFAVALGNVVTTGSVVVNSGSYIDIVGNANITGNLSLTAAGNVTNAAALGGNLYAPTATISNTTGRLTGISVSNGAALSYGSAPVVTVSGGANPTTIGTATPTVTNGQLTALAVATAGAGYTFAPTVTLSAPTLTNGVQATATATVAGGVITGFTITNAGAGYAAAPTVTISGGADATAAATVTANLGATGQITGFNVTNSLTNGATIPYFGGTPITISVTPAVGQTTTTSIAQSSGTLKVGGTTTINMNGSAGNALLFRSNDLNTVVLGGNSTAGGALINDVNNITVSGTSAGNVAITAGSNGGGSVGTGAPFTEANPWAVTLGQLNVGSLNVTAANGGAGNSGRITQTANTTIHSFGAASFTTSNNSITLGNAGNNFGRVGLTSGGGAITFVEAGTIKLGNLSTGNGTTSLTSTFGGIIEDPAADVSISQGSGGTMTLTSANGSILLGGVDHTAGVTTGSLNVVNASAPNGAVKLTSTGNVTLGNIDANSLTVASGNNIAQNNAAKVFGTTTFSATNNITLTNNANNFGRIFVTTTAAGANVSITEGGTMNLGRVTMAASATGNFTATSVAGDIIDTGLGGVRPGGVVGTAGTGVVTLAAAAGNVLLDDPTTDFPTTGGVVFNAKNVTLSPLGGAALYLGASGQTATASGNLTVTSATGSIFNAGPVNVTGDAFFQSGSGDILMTNSSNNFGTVKFAGKIVSITEAGHLTLVTGSSATGAATFTTAGGDISIVDRGGSVSLASTGLFNASGSITLPKLIQVSDTLTVSAAGTKDLSKLSVSGDLGNKAPQNFGTGTYLPPLP
jgi:hypothetical protein